MTKKQRQWYEMALMHWMFKLDYPYTHEDLHHRAMQSMKAMQEMVSNFAPIEELEKEVD